MGRAPCCENGVRKGPWGEEEDKALIDFIQRHGHGNWRSLPKRAGLLRCGKSCRLRWINYLRPDIKHGKLTAEEEEIIISMHAKLGNKWSAIAANLPGRTDNEIKNVWHTYLKKRTHPQEATPAAVSLSKTSRRIQREAKKKLHHSVSSANESGGHGTSLLQTQLSVELSCNGLSSPDISFDSTSAVTGVPYYFDEGKDIDKSFWLEALSMDITPLQVMDAAVGDAFSSYANSESMEFWLKVFMDAESLENMPQMESDDTILAT